MTSSHHTIRVVDSHTEGEPTRVVIDGGPDLGSGSIAERLERFRREFDRFRSAVVNEPRGSDPMVGALLCAPTDPGCTVGVIFFNNVGYLGMCGHGTIGLITTLAHLERIEPGTHRIETPVGVIAATLEASGKVSVANIPSYRYRSSVVVDVAGVGRFTGDVAWGGNWFFLVNDHREILDPGNVERLTNVTWAIREALTASGITGENGAEIDHVELFGPPAGAGAN
ncbi:MAG: hydroxyproline-2-epimerase, partial [Candidatus Aminicenantes bacterium]